MKRRSSFGSFSRRGFLASTMTGPLLLNTACAPSANEASDEGLIDVPAEPKAIERSPIEIYGVVAAGFEPVRDRFIELSHLIGDGGAAFAVCVNGEPVVDLWGGNAAADQKWEADTRNVIQSTSKAVTAMAAMLLIDRGELSLDARVTDYWPEYGAEGKGETTVKHLLSHAGGAARLPGYEDLLDVSGEGWDQYEEIGARLAAAEPSWVPGTAHGYHTYTYGFLIGELVYRITGQRIGPFLRQELFSPHQLNIWLGTPIEEQAKVAKIDTSSVPPLPDEIPEALANLLTNPEFAAAAAAAIKPGDLPYDAGFQAVFTANGQTYFDGIAELWNSSAGLAAQVGSANATSDARSLARLMSVYANSGEIAGQSVFSPQTIEAFMTPAEPGGADKILRSDQKWTPGSLTANQIVPSFGLPAVYGPNMDTIGMTGGGGQFAIADPSKNMSAGFVRNHYDNTMGLSSHLAATLYECLE